MYYMRLPTYDWLAKKGITPSNTTTYTLSDMQNALAAEFGIFQIIRIVITHPLTRIQEPYHILVAQVLNTTLPLQGRGLRTQDGPLWMKVREKSRSLKV